MRLFIFAAAALLALVPQAALACGGTLNCPAWNADGTDCTSAGSSVCNWSACTGSLNCDVWDSDQGNCQGAGASVCTWNSIGCSDNFCPDSTSCTNASQDSYDNGAGSCGYEQITVSACSDLPPYGQCVDFGGYCFENGGVCNDARTYYTDATSCGNAGYTWDSGSGICGDTDQFVTCDNLNVQYYPCPDLAPWGCDNNGGCGASWGGTSCTNQGGAVCSGVSSYSTCTGLGSAGCSWPGCSNQSGAACWTLAQSNCKASSAIGCSEPTYTNDPLVPGVTAARAVHVTELRTLINNLYSSYGFSAPTWTNPTIVPGQTTIRATHITEMRNAISALETAFPSCNDGAPTWTHGTLVAGTSTVSFQDITDLRNAIDNIDPVCSDGNIDGCCGPCGTCNGSSGCATASSGATCFAGHCDGSGRDSSHCH